MSNLYVYLMCSRNKDNKNIPGFKERSKNILEYIENEDRVREAFKDFASKGLPGEQTRLYRSVNSRNEDKIREDLLVRLIKDKPSVTKLDRILASVSQQVYNRDESKWLFDFDVDDENLMNEFVTDVKRLITPKPDPSKSIIPHIPKVNVSKTPHGYAIVVPHGFDTRELMDKWKDYDITKKKMSCYF